MILEKEQAFFEAHRPEWLKYHQGKVALVVGEELIGVYDNAEAAFDAGVERFGNVPMLIKQVQATDPVAHIPALFLGLMNAGI
jgi:hypothetical protein